MYKIEYNQFYNFIMICKQQNKTMPAYYLPTYDSLPNMKEVRANFLFYTKQSERLNDLRVKINGYGYHLEMQYTSRKLRMRLL
jgi:hypothetical protein